MKKEKRGLSLSLAGHCRMELWLIHHKPEKAEERSLTGQRTVEIGAMIEQLIFDTFEIPTAYGPETIGGWFGNAAQVKDPVSGFSFEPSEAKVEARQWRVALPVMGPDGPVEIFGSMDALVQPKGVDVWLVSDAKSAAGHNYRRAATSKLVGEVFSHEYVIQLQMYEEGARRDPEILRRFGLVKAGFLLYFSKEQSQMMVRLIPYDPALVDEGLERLSAGLAKAEPVPDYQWERGQKIPLRCSYCDMRQACAEVRGMRLEIGTEKGRPFWTVR